MEAEAAGEASHTGKDDWMCSEQDDPPDQAARLTRVVQAQITRPATTALATSRRPQGEPAASAGTGDCPTLRLPPPSRRRWSPRSPPAGMRSSRSAPRRHEQPALAGQPEEPVAVVVVGRPVGSGVDGEEDEIEIRSVRLLQRLGWEPRRASPSEPTRSSSSSAGLSSGSIPFVGLSVLLARSHKWVLRRRVE